MDPILLEKVDRLIELFEWSIGVNVSLLGGIVVLAFLIAKGDLNI